MKTCCMCGLKYSGCGNNPAPFDGEECCPDCDDRFVTPVRMLLGRNYSNRTVLTLIQTIVELGTSIHNVNGEMRREFPKLVEPWELPFTTLREADETSGEGNSGEPPKAG